MPRSFSIREYSLFSGIILCGIESSLAQIVYTDLDPDIVVGPDNQFVDIDGDGVNDFEFHAELLARSNTLWQCYSTVLFEIECLYPGNSLIGYLAEGQKDVVYAIDYGYPINSDAELTPDDVQYATVKWQYVSCLYFNPVSPWFYPNIGHWASQRKEDIFVGFRFYEAEDDCPRFGWMRCIITEDLEQIVIKDFAYNVECEHGLFAGMLISEISNATIDPLLANVYMANNYLNIVLTEAPTKLDLRLFSMSKQLILQEEITDKATSIPTSSFISGIYYIQLLSDEGEVFTKKIFIN